MDNSIFSKVIIVVPSFGNGGIAYVVKSYLKTGADFKYICTKSNKSKVLSALTTFYAIIKLIVLRVCTSRKILHIHFSSGTSFSRKRIFIILGKWLGFKVIGHCHGSEFKQFAQKVGYERIKSTLGKCDSIIVLSQSWKEYFNDVLGLKTTAIGNPVFPVKDLSPQSHHEKVELLFMGKIGGRKGIFDLVDVLSHLQDDNKKKVHLIVCGNGDVEKLEQVIKDCHLEDVIQFVGWVDNEKKDGYMRTCDVAVLPSYNEGLPVFLLEALTYGKAVISTTVGGIPEIVKNGINGYLITAGDKLALADAINNYIENPSLPSQHGLASLDIVKPYYIDEVMKSLENEYRNCLNK